jgi:hypothetical protein
MKEKFTRLSNIMFSAGIFFINNSKYLSNNSGHISHTAFTRDVLGQFYHKYSIYLDCSYLVIYLILLDL